MKGNTARKEEKHTKRAGGGGKSRPTRRCPRRVADAYNPRVLGQKGEGFWGVRGGTVKKRENGKRGVVIVLY